MGSTGFRGGGGGYRAQCGALNSGILAIGLVFGRIGADEDEECASEITKQLCERFQEAMGHLSCHVLREEYQCGSVEKGQVSQVYYMGAKLATEVMLTAHKDCPACGGFDGAISRNPDLV